VFYDKVKVPVDSILAERNEGFKIAVNALNAGRIKLGAAVVGAAFKVIGLAVNYANERKQFGRTIGSFGAIQQKLADMATLTYVSDAALYRAGQDIEDNQNRLVAKGLPEAEAKLKGIEEYAVECAIIKVFCSEAMAFVADEGVQIYGGMGYSADAPMEAAYRDARISRIYEGTNEINRMLTVDMLLRKALKGQLDLLGPAMKVAQELMDIPDFSAEEEVGLFVAEKKVLKNLKKATLLVAGAAVQKFADKLDQEQEILMQAADMAIEVYVLESAILKTEKLATRLGEAACAERIDMVVSYTHRAANKVNMAGKEAIYAIAEGDEQRMMLLGLKRFTKTEAVNLKEVRRRIAAKLLDENRYPFA